MHLSLKLKLGNFQQFLSRVLSGRVLDLFGSFTQDDTTVSDSSGEGNDATLYSGRYISTDGSTDRGIVADCSAAGAGNYYLTGKVRPNAVTTAELTMDGSTDSGLTGLTADVWQDFTTATSAVTPSAVQVGYDGSTASAADWSDVRLVNATTGATVARYQLTESADGDLDGYPALDSSGNGYHGTHTGCAGGTGEGIDADVAGAVFAANEDKMYFDGVDDSIDLDTPESYAGAFEFEFNVLFSEEDACVFVADSSVNNIFIRTNVVLSSIECRIAASNISVGLDSPLSPRQLYNLKFIRSASNVFTIEVDGVEQADNAKTVTGTFIVNRIGARNLVFNPFKGVIKNAVTSGGTTFDGTIANGNEIGTVNGNPVTVGQKRATILQTAGMDWNRGYPLSNDLTVDWVEAGVGSIIDSNTFTTTTAAAGVYHPITLGRTYRYEISGTTTGGFQIWDWGTGGSILAAKTGSGSFSFSGTFTTAGSSRQFYIRASNGAIQVDLTSIVLVWDNYLIPASDATPTNDALGNAIAEPRPTADTWNLFGDGEYGRVADADSLDVTTAATWEIWGNFYGATAANESYLSKTDITNGTRVFQIYRDAVENSDEEITILLGSATGTFGAGEEFDVPDSVCQVCVTFDSGTLKAYVNGSEVTLNNLSGTIPSSLFATTSPVGVGARRNAGTWGSFSKNQISRPKIYNRALTADEVLKNYNAQKGAFGL